MFWVMISLSDHRKLSLLQTLRSRLKLISKPMINWHERLVLFIETHDIKLDGKEEREEFSLFRISVSGRHLLPVF